MESVHAVSVWEPQRKIRRVSCVDPDEVMRRHLVEGEGEPLVVRDAQTKWFPKGRWSLETLARDYGSEEVFVNDVAPFCEWDEPPMRTRKVTVAEYAAYARGEACGLANEASGTNRRWYLNSWEPFSRHADMLAAWDYPYFVEDLITHTNATNPKLVDYSKLFVGVPGCTTRLHFDAQQTHAWLAQVQGRKHFVLFAPSDGPKLRLHAWEAADGDGLRRALDPARPPDRNLYPHVYDAVPFVTILEPGEILLVPRGWWHYARCLDVCVTIMRNFANAANREQFQAAMCRGTELADRSTPKRLVVPGTACIVCGDTSVAKPCSRCRAVSYCGRACQKAHWRQHQLFCPLLAKLALDTEHMTPAPAPSTTDLFAPLRPNAARAEAANFAKDVLIEGTGRAPGHDDAMVRVHYHGFLADGQKIDSSLDKGHPLDFHLTHATVAKGWREAIRTMRTGEKARIAVPPHAAYADRGVEGKVAPNSALVFEVQLLELW